MGEESSITRPQDIDLETNKYDVTAIAAKGVLGAIPFVGSLLSEIVTTTIPQQKLERLTIFIKVLDDKVKNIEESILREKLSSEEGTDLLEDGLRQASRALSEERKHYIASIIKNSMTQDDLDHSQKKFLMYLLNQLNDVEIIHLKFYSLRRVQERNEYEERHEHILVRRTLFDTSPQSDVDREAMLSGYRNHLLQLELIKAEYKMPDRNSGVEFDRNTGKLKVTHYSATDLGDLLLRYIDLS